MTSDDAPRDGSRDDPANGTPEGPTGPGSPFDAAFDEDAAWRLIVENYGERALLDGTSEPSPTSAAPGEDTAPPVDREQPPGPEQPRQPREPRLFDRSYLDSVDPTDASEPPETDHPATYPDERSRRSTDEHDHFVPPEPPPIPRGTPARRIAWAGLFGSPLLMVLAVVFGWAFPTWLSMLLVAAFVGGFVFLIATMPRDGGDGWGDGAVV
jgi:hypothetical protein